MSNGLLRVRIRLTEILFVPEDDLLLGLGADTGAVHDVRNIGPRVANLAGKRCDGNVRIQHIMPDRACPSRNLYPAATSFMSGQIYSSFRFANVFTFV